MGFCVYCGWIHIDGLCYSTDMNMVFTELKTAQQVYMFFYSPFECAKTEKSI